MFFGKALAIVTVSFLMTACSGTWEPSLRNKTLTISVDPELSDEQVEAVQKAAQYWNEKTDMNLFFVTSDDFGDSNQVNMKNKAPRKGEMATAWQRKDRCDVHMKDLIPGPEFVTVGGLTTAYTPVWKILAHELGHCLTLEHDDIPSSLMYGIAGRSQELTAEDIEYVQARAGME